MRENGHSEKKEKKIMPAEDTSTPRPPEINVGLNQTRLIQGDFAERGGREVESRRWVICAQLEEQEKQNKTGHSCVADDDSRTLFAQDTPLFGLGTPVPALLAAEESEHARWFLSLGVLYKRGALVSHLGP